MRVPTSPQEITPEWLTEALREGGHLPSGSVASIAMSQVGVGRGYAGLTIQLDVGYEDAPAGMPGSFVVKMPLQIEIDGVSELTTPAHVREVRWYHELQERTPVRSPVCYWGGADPETSSSCLVLEDLSHLRATDQINSCRPNDARIAIRHLARIHAAWWRSEELASLEWLPPSENTTGRLADSCRATWPALARDFASIIPPDFQTLGASIARVLPDLIRDGVIHGRTLMHGDYRLENFFFGKPGEPDELVVLDWQAVEHGSGARDLAYFMAQNLPIGDRRRNEPSLLRLYHDELTHLGVTDYSYDALYEDYRRGLLLALHVPLNAHQILMDLESSSSIKLPPEQEANFSQAVGAARLLVRTMIERNTAAVIDNSAQELAGVSP